MIGQVCSQSKKTAKASAFAVNSLGGRLRDPLMGEEKPDEELMGKRKSSPRLSTTLFGCRYLQYVPIWKKIYGLTQKFCGLFAEYDTIATANPSDPGSHGSPVYGVIHIA
jgi:hypothetical protein